MRNAIIVSLFMLCAVSSAVARPAPEPEVQVTEKEIKSFEATKVSLPEAIKIAAEKKGMPGSSMAVLTVRLCRLTYKVKTLSGK